MPEDSRFEACVAALPGYARPLFAHVRALTHRAIPGVEEGIKWGKPTFIYRGKNVATFAAFKAHAMFVVHGEGRQAEGTDGGRIATLADLPGDNTLIAALDAARQRIEASGTAVRRRPAAARAPRAELPVPAELAAALAANGAAAATFAALSPSHRRDYLQWIAEAKRPDTRARRIAAAAEKLAAGAKSYWKAC